MANNEFITYLNSLHNYRAQNANSYGEKNVGNRFFQKVMVKVGLGEFIYNRISGDEPHAIILTGHAGDGKTSIMYQVLSELNIKFEADKKIADYYLPSGRLCRCVKDFSEISDENKAKELETALKMPADYNFVFMVANTGPLINTFGELFADKTVSERAKIQLIEAMDSNTGEIASIQGYKICVINVASIDNTYFANEFLNKLIADELWETCSKCPKKNYCHIVNNRNIIYHNRERVGEFIYMHYVWLTDHGKRLTIRSMTEQLAYMITGGINCDEVRQEELYKYLFTNLFFGYVGTVKNNRALNITAVKEANGCGYDRKRLRSDERLIINYDINKLFGLDMAGIIQAAESDNAFLPGWQEFLRRAYYFTNIETDEAILEMNYEDIFSKQFKRYLDLKSAKKKPARVDANLVCDALSMIYVGTTSGNSMIPITLSRESGLAQNVQLIIGELMTKNIKLVQIPAKASTFTQGNQRCTLRLEINKKLLKSEVSLPLMNYFEELKNGIISTNVDPQLSHGIESLKAELSELVEGETDDVFDMVILRNSGPKPVTLEITDDNNLREV